MRLLTLLLSASVLMAGASRADVLDSQPTGFTISRKVAIAAPPNRVWAALGKIGDWWDPQHTYSHDAHNLSLDLKSRGVFAETLPSGGWVRHMVVVYADTDKLLRLQGGLGPLQAYGVAGSLTFSLKPDGAGTMLVETYDVGGHVPGGLDKLAATVDGVMNHQLDRLAAYAEGRTLP